jgi:hypothetical protein
LLTQLAEAVVILCSSILIRHLVSFIEEDGSWRKLQIEELHNLYSSPNIIRMIMGKRMRWAGYIARIEEKPNSWEFG